MYCASMSAAERARGTLGRLGGRLRHGLGRTWSLLVNAVRNFLHRRGTQNAAAMAYYALFSVFPTVIVLAAAAGFVLDDPGAREEVIDYLLEELPLTADQGRDDIERVLDGVTANSRTLGVIGVAGLLITASALMSATRNAVNLIFEDEVRRGAIRGKAVDVAMVLGLGVLFTLSFGLSLVTQLDLVGGSLGDLIESLLNFSGDLLPPILAAIVFGVLYRVLPTEHPPLRAIWPGVLFAAIGYEILKRAFAFYLDNFADYSAVYGSLGAVIAFMFFIFVASIVFLIGAEMAAIWPGVKAGEYDPDPDEEGKPFLHELRDWALGLFRRNRPDDP
jgi:membrane protein